MNATIVLAILSIVMILLSVPSSVLFVQNASALASVAQITSAKADGSDIANGAFATIAQGKTTVRVTFDYRGFDDNDHVLELRCSWDGVNYQKSNCSTESTESRITLTGPDGVARAYYVKTGTASRDLAAPPVPKTYTFGVKVLNENGNLSPAATWTFKMRSNTNPPVGGAEEEGGTVKPENNFQKIKVRFDSITIKDDHEADFTVPGFRGAPSVTTAVSGEWELIAYVQGKGIGLLDNKPVYSGKTYKFKPGTEITVNLKVNVPLSIFTIGIEPDCTAFLDIFPPGGFHVRGPLTGYDEKLATLLSNPTSNWLTEIGKIQKDMNAYIAELDCHNPDDILGVINKIYLSPDYLSTLTPEQLARVPDYLRGWFIGPDFAGTSSTDDFTLRYTVSVE